MCIRIGAIDFVTWTNTNIHARGYIHKEHKKVVRREDNSI